MDEAGFCPSAVGLVGSRPDTFCIIVKSFIFGDTSLFNCRPSLCFYLDPRPGTLSPKAKTVVAGELDTGQPLVPSLPLPLSLFLSFSPSLSLSISFFLSVSLSLSLPLSLSPSLPSLPRPLSLSAPLRPYILIPLKPSLAITW